MKRINKLLIITIGILVITSLVGFATALAYNENPMFAEKVKKGELPPVEERLPEEPLVVTPYDRIGKYGGMLRGISLAYETGTSEIMSWRQVNMVRLDDDFSTIMPDVAKEWKWNDDFTEILFRLRKDIILNKEIHKVTPSPWGSVGASVEKIDDVTVKFKFDKPYPGFLSYLTSAGCYFVPWAPKHFLQQYHIKYNPNANEEAIKNGFDNWVQQFGSYWNKWKDAIVSSAYGLEVPTLGSHILMKEPTTQRRVFVANPYYFKVDTAGNQLPYIDYHEERFLEKQLIPLEIMNGNVDQGSQNISFPLYPTLKKNEKKGNYTLQLPGGAAGINFIFNMTEKDPVLKKIYADKRFRYAMSLAINRDEVNETFFFGLGTPGQTVPKYVPYVTEEDKKFMAEYDPERANELLDEMGLKRGKYGIRMRPDGKPLKILWEYCQQMVLTPELPALIVEYWKAVGVDVVLKEVTAQLTREKYRANILDILNEWEFLPTIADNYVPPYGIPWPCMGLPWMDWKNSNGKLGEEPPDWVKRLWEIEDEWVTVVPGSQRYMELGKEMVKINLENMVIIGTLNELPLINVVSNRLGNTPKWTISSFNYGYAAPYQADQWYFK